MTVSFASVSATQNALIPPPRFGRVETYQFIDGDHNDAPITGAAKRQGLYHALLRHLIIERIPVVCSAAFILDSTYKAEMAKLGGPFTYTKATQKYVAVTNDDNEQSINRLNTLRQRLKDATSEAAKRDIQAEIDTMLKDPTTITYRVKNSDSSRGQRFYRVV